MKNIMDVIAIARLLLTFGGKGIAERTSVHHSGKEGKTETLAPTSKHLPAPVTFTRVHMHPPLFYSRDTILSPRPSHLRSNDT